MDYVGWRQLAKHDKISHVTVDFVRREAEARQGGNVVRRACPRKTPMWRTSRENGRFFMHSAGVFCRFWQTFLHA